MPTAAVFGRDDELDLADSVLESAPERLRILLLEGEAGIGKTTLWRAVLRRAEAQGFRVLSCRPVQAETKLALSALADLLEPVGGHPTAAALPRHQRRALDVALLRAEPDAAPLDQRTLGTAVRALLAGLSAERPVVVAIDDVQWLDAASATVIAFALRRLTAAPLAGLLARRLPEADGRGAEPLVPAESVTRCTLDPLAPAALHDLLSDRLGRPLSRSVVARVHETSGGNPMFALEIMRQLGPAPAVNPRARLPVPENLRKLVAGRLPAPPPHARDALLAAAALSDPTPALVEGASSAGGLAAAEELGLLRADDGRIAFAHPLYASVVYDSASQRRRRDLHRRLAELVPGSEQRARHLALATTEPDEDVARALERGAAQARSRGAWASSAELLEEAGAVTPPDRRDDARRRALAAAEHHVHGGDRARARTLLEALLPEPLPRSQRANALRLLGGISQHDDNVAEAQRRFAEALEQADDPRAVVDVELGLGRVCGSTWDIGAGVAHASRALERAEAIGDGALVAEALAQRAMFDYLAGRGVDDEAVERALALEDRDRLTPLDARPGTIAALLLLYLGDHAQARERLAAIRAAAGERGEESDLAFVVLWLSWLETRSGDLVAALAAAEEAASVAALTGRQSTYSWALAQRAYVDAHRGETAAARRGCREAGALVERFGYTLPAVWIASALSLLELSLGNPEGAWRACEPLAATLEARGLGEPVTAFFLPDALEALIALGAVDRAAALLAMLDDRGRALDRPWALATAGRCRALLLAARGELDGAAAAADGALAEHDRLDMPFELARTLVVHGVVERRRRRRSRAKASFERALELFESMGARLWAERARLELGRVGIRRSAPGDLTAGERRVAVLTAGGLTNREVARALSISPKTVEANLSRVYRKLGITSRAELGARMAGVQE